MNARLFLLPAALLAGAGQLVAGTTDIPIGFVPPTWVAASVRKTLSPQGKFFIINETGMLRVTDSEEKIADVYRVLDGLQKAPALVGLELSFVTYTTKTVEHAAVVAPSGGDEFPFPRKFSPPKILQNPNGGFTVVPSQPSEFRGRSTGAAAGVQPTVTTTTEQTKQVIRRVAASSIPDKPAPVPLLARVDDVAALRALAVKLGAVKADEPAWAAASTELLVKTELLGAQLQVTVTPQVALPAAAAGTEPRRIPFKKCAAAITITRGAPVPLGKLPNTDGEFYHLFIGAPPTGPNDTTALSMTSQVRYVGTQPP